MKRDKRIAALALAAVLWTSGGVWAAEAQPSEVYIAAKTAELHAEPSEDSEVLTTFVFGEQLHLAGEAGTDPADWVSVTGTTQDGASVTGYLTQAELSGQRMLQRTTEQSTAATDGEILDYPGRKDGEVIGELLEYDDVQRTASVGDTWSQIVFLNEEDQETVGYIPTVWLKGHETTPTPLPTVTEAPEDEKQGTDAKKDPSAKTEQDAKTDQKDAKEDPEQGGVLHEGSGAGVFSDANEGVTAQGGVDGQGVQVGSPVGVAEGSTLTPLGVFRITHYCPCSICCGPYTDGITSTGVTATTNHTIAVDPTQIPYGSKVVINGQVYVAEDCGGAIKTNCIDVYVATHAEGEAKGVFYTDVYLLNG